MIVNVLSAKYGTNCMSDSIDLSKWVDRVEKCLVFLNVYCPIRERKNEYSCRPHYAPVTLLLRSSRSYHTHPVPTTLSPFESVVRT